MVVSKYLDSIVVLCCEASLCYLKVLVYLRKLSSKPPRSVLLANPKYTRGCTYKYISM